MKLRNLLPVLLLAVTIGCTAPPVPPPMTTNGTITNLIRIDPGTPPSQETVTVRSVYDGDTYTLGDGRKVRILGIDTPEIRGKECYAHEARDQAAALLLNQQVTITGDPEQSDHDRYGRILRYVTLTDGTDVGARLINGGYARVYREYPVTKTVSYNAFEHQAQQLGTGGWSACGWGK